MKADQKPTRKTARMPSGRLENLDPEIIEGLRRAAGISKENLAVKVGVSPNMISRWFQGEASPAPPRALRLAQALGVDVLDLTGRTMATADIVDLRQRHGWTTQDVAEISGRLSKPVIYTIERAHPVPSADKLDHLAEIYEVSPSQVRRSWVNRRVHRFGTESLAYLTDEERDRLAPWA
ncbi:helix-turn-helix transcriptional regulator [Corynebacterium kalidii]